MERLADLGYASLPMLKDLAKSKFLERLMEYDRASLDAMKRLKEHNLASEAVLNKIKEIEQSL